MPATTSAKCSQLKIRVLLWPKSTAPESECI